MAGADGREAERADYRSRPVPRQKRGVAQLALIVVAPAPGLAAGSQRTIMTRAYRERAQRVAARH